jgi:hypothetical protein
MAATAGASAWTACRKRFQMSNFKAVLISLWQKATRRNLVPYYVSVTGLILGLLIALFALRHHHVQPDSIWSGVGDFSVYLWSVFGHWQAYATGGGATALLLVYERLVKPISTVTFRWIVLVAFVAAASFTAWRDSYLSMKGRERDLVFANRQIDAYRAKSAEGPQILFNPQISVQAPATPRSPEERQELRAIREALTASNQAKQLSNKDLAQRVIDLTLKMRTLESEYLAKDQQISEEFSNRMVSAKSNGERETLVTQEQSAKDQLRSQRDLIDRTRMEGEARFLRDEMLSQLPPQPKTAESVFFDMGGLAGPSPLNDHANYLELLARRLAP